MGAARRGPALSAPPASDVTVPTGGGGRLPEKRVAPRCLRLLLFRGEGRGRAAAGMRVLSGGDPRR